MIMKFQLHSFAIVLICITLLPSQVFGNSDLNFSSEPDCKQCDKKPAQQRLEYNKKWPATWAPTRASTRNYNL